MPDIGGFPGILNALWVAFWIFFVAMTLSLILRLHIFLNKALPLLDAVKSLVDQFKDQKVNGAKQPDTGPDTESELEERSHGETIRRR